MTDVLDAIRAACRDVAAGARHVTIRAERLAPLAAELPAPSAAPGPDPAQHWLGHGEGTATFMLLLDAGELRLGLERATAQASGPHDLLDDGPRR